VTVTDAFLASLMGRALDTPVTVHRRTRLGGGSINETERVDTDAGTFVLKSHQRPPDGFFRAEADGLAALAGSGTPLVIPRVIAWHDANPACLVIEYLHSTSRAPDFDGRLGRGLAALHRSRHARFGFAHDNFCGTTPQRNPWTDHWVEFYATARLDAQVRLARDGGQLDASDAQVLDRLIGHLGRWIEEPADGPSLIHGDLWSGNLHVGADGGPALFDPAVSYAHREAELGMMTLFGGFSERVFATYHEAYPLDAGWRERNGLYQLYHLLNHLNLFGGGYYGQVMQVIRQYV
jgi:protein-ribulosamine 3-kinase